MHVHLFAHEMNIHSMQHAECHLARDRILKENKGKSALRSARIGLTQSVNGTLTFDLRGTF